MRAGQPVFTECESLSMKRGVSRMGAASTGARPLPGGKSRTGPASPLPPWRPRLLIVGSIACETRHNGDTHVIGPQVFNLNFLADSVFRLSIKPAPYQSVPRNTAARPRAGT